MDGQIKQRVSDLWQNTTNSWKDNAASQYYNSCITLLEGVLDRVHSLNNDLDGKVSETLNKVRKYESL